MHSLLIWAALVALLSYVGGPILIRFKQKAKAHPKFESLDASDIPDALAHYVYSTANALREDGFIPEAYLSLPDQVPNVRAYLILLANRPSGDKAMVTVMMTHQEGKTPQVGTHYVEFSTRYASGKVVDTMNGGTLGAFKTLPGEVKTQIPQVQDPHALCLIHRHILDRLADVAPGDEKVMYPEGDAARYLAGVMEKGYEEQAALGLLYRDEEGGEAIFRPTWYGAFYMTWGLLFPIKQIRQMRAAQRATAVLRSFRESQSDPLPS
jgi:hypothetical protein